MHAQFPAREFIPGQGLVDLPAAGLAPRGVHERVCERPTNSSADATQPRHQSRYPQWDQQPTNSQDVIGEDPEDQQQLAAAQSSRLTPSAAPFVPGELRSSPQARHTPEPQVQHEKDEQEAMVEVVRGGCIFFVPESMAYENSGEYEIVDEEGFDWAMGANTLPAPPKRSLQTIGIPEPIRQHFQALDIEALRQMPSNDERYKEIPSSYHSAYALDDPHTPRGTAGSFGYPSALYKVTSHEDAQLYALRRFDNVKTTSSIVKNALDRWRVIRHPSIVSLYSAFLHHRGTLFFAHAYHPTAQTMRQRFIDQQSGGLLNEGMLWRFLVQILAGIRAVHSRGMACRVIDPTHILFTSGMRVRINCVGVMDVLEFESQRSLYDLQRDDMHSLGRIMLSLGTRADVKPSTSQQAVLFCSQHYSQDFQTCIVALLKKTPANVHEMFRLASVHVADELDMSMASADALHGHLCNEYENGRLLRLLLKLGTINERPGHALDPQWAETGDRYVLKLFRDYTFHQVGEGGNPVIDFGHIVSTLNKLDAADDEKVLLTSRDEKSLLVVSFADVKRCLEQAFQELYSQSSAPAAVIPPSVASRTQSYIGRSGYGSAHGPEGYESANSHPYLHAQAQGPLRRGRGGYDNTRGGRRAGRFGGR